MENQRKRKYGYQRNFEINLHPIDSLGMEFTACSVELMSHGDIIYRM